MAKRILTTVVKVTLTLIAGYFAVMAILIAISPELIPNQKEDDDFDDFYDDPKHRKELEEFEDLYDEYENERYFGCECADEVTMN